MKILTISNNNLRSPPLTTPSCALPLSPPLSPTIPSLIPSLVLAFLLLHAYEFTKKSTDDEAVQTGFSDSSQNNIVWQPLPQQKSQFPFAVVFAAAQSATTPPQDTLPQFAICPSYPTVIGYPLAPYVPLLLTNYHYVHDGSCYAYGVVLNVPKKNAADDKFAYTLKNNDNVIAAPYSLSFYSFIDDSIERPPSYVTVENNTFRELTGFFIRGSIPAGSIINMIGNSFFKGNVLPYESGVNNGGFNFMSMIAWYNGWSPGTAINLNAGAQLNIERNSFQMQREIADAGLNSMSCLNLRSPINVRSGSSIRVVGNTVTDLETVTYSGPKGGIELENVNLEGATLTVANNTVVFDANAVTGLSVIGKLKNGATTSRSTMTVEGNTVSTNSVLPFRAQATEMTAATANIVSISRNTVQCLGTTVAQCVMPLLITQSASAPRAATLTVALNHNKVFTLNPTAIVSMDYDELTLPLEGPIVNINHNTVENMLNNNGNRPYFRVIVGTIQNNTVITFYRNSARNTAAVGAVTYDKILQRGSSAVSGTKEQIIARGSFTVSMNTLGGTLLATRDDNFNAMVSYNNYGGGTTFWSCYSCDCGDYLTTATCVASNLVCDFRGQQRMHIVCMSDLGVII